MERRKSTNITILDNAEYEEFLEMLNGIPVSLWFRRKMRDDLELYRLAKEEGRFIPLRED